MEDREAVQADAPLSDSSSADDDSEWEAFGTAFFQGKTATSNSPHSRYALHDADLKGGKRQPDSREVSVKEGEAQEGGEGRKPLPLVQTTPHRWVDYCSASSRGSGGSRSSSATNSSSEDLRLLLPGRSDARAYVPPPSTFLPDGAHRCAPGFEGGGGDGGGRGHGGGRFIAHVGQRPRCSFVGRDISEEQHHRSSDATARCARRLPLSVYTDATVTTSLQAQQGYEQHLGPQNTWSFPTNSRLFAWFVLLHGCLCEAPLAVVEGLVRGPLYLGAAAWIAIVSLIGASSRHAEQRAELSRHAAALAREGILLLVTSLTLVVPFSTSFTVYGEVIDRTDDWDVHAVPTLLGAVDPRRFFVFAFGQAGELASNGRPEPLHQPGDTSQISRWAVAPSTSPLSLQVAAGGGRRGRPDDCIVDGSERFSSPVSYVGLIAAQSMDADRLGVGILHPPQEIGLRFRRGGATARRATVSAYRRLATRAATTYRRLPTSGIVMARIRGLFSIDISATRNSSVVAAVSRSGHGACVI